MSSSIRSSALLFRNATTQSNLMKMRNRVNTVKDQAVSGLKVREASDAPASWPYVSDLVDSIGDQEVLGKNAGRAISMLGVADSTLREASSVMKRAREVAVRFSTGSFNDEDRASAASEIDGLRDSMLDLANTDVGGRYIFSGNAYDAPAFDSTGAYVGSNDTPTITIGEDGDSVTAGFDGAEVFLDSLTALEDLADAMRTGTPADIQDQIDPVDLAMKDVITTRSIAGGQYKRATDVQTLTESLTVVLNESLAEEVATDPFESYQEFTQLTQSLEATLQLTARSNSMSTLFSRI